MPRFRKGDIVWHKTSGWPWWPSRVEKIESTPNGDLYTLHDFGTEPKHTQVSLNVNAKDICTWWEKKPLKKLSDTMRYVYSQKDQESYQGAVSQAVAKAGMPTGKRAADGGTEHAPKAARSSAAGSSADHKTISLADDEAEVKAETSECDSDSDDDTVALAKKLLEIDAALAKARHKAAEKKKVVEAKRATAIQKAKAADELAAKEVADLEASLHEAKKRKDATAAKLAAVQAAPAAGDAEIQALVAKEQKLAAEKKEVKAAMRK